MDPPLLFGQRNLMAFSWRFTGWPRVSKFQLIFFPDPIDTAVSLLFTWRRPPTAGRAPDVVFDFLKNDGW